MVDHTKVDDFLYNDFPDWLSPISEDYLLLLDQKIVRFRPWYLLNADLIVKRNDGLKLRYPDRMLFAFAARMDCDDIACWERGRTGKVSVVHDFASPGFEAKENFDSFWDWFRTAVDQMITFEN